jgi:O-antigen/teichoic acid export membrane protein
MASSRQAIHGLFWSVAERVATQGITFAVLLLLARLLGPENYGLVTLAATIALFGQMLLGETFSQALIQEKTVEPAHSSSVFWLLAILGFLAAAAQFCAAGWLAQIFGQPAVAPILRALSPLLLLAALQAVPTTLLRRELNFRAVFAASTLGTLLGGAVAVAMALAGFGIWSLVANLLIQNAISVVTIWRRSAFKPSLEFSQPHLGALWSYGRYTLLLRVAAFVANQSPRLIVGYLFGPMVLGSFSLGLRIIEMIYQLLVIPATNVIVPLIARIRENPQRLENAILGATHMTAVLAAAVYITLAITAPIAIPLIFGARWLASVPLVQILCFYGVIISSGQIWQSLLGGLGRPDIALRATVAAAIANVGALLLSTHWGPVAAAGAFVFRGYVTLPFMPLIIARLTGLSASRQYGVFLPIILAAGLMAAAEEIAMILLAHRLGAPILLAAILTVGAIVYGVALYALDRRALQKGLSVLRHLQPAPV